ncbi:filamentous hemagglutinin N-terminal domain-containing protein [Candidatus Albibeggiatoa sp. nov. NOAA]|uniref:two-partner secretion domain-containing protein n=1 Tax=Candidatus Albibeggiatoa sp. nov. NOAA TaxID=3162724 RepID=UPI003301C754|nr:filamentous hemagglutinin N-terminal domain-containing protein [Thiotrichaceae bacterium]
MRGFLCLLVCVTHIVQADISINNEQLSVNNGLYNISQDVGQTVGNNLFHTFDRFNIAQGEIAQFSGNHTIQNIISRVIGGEASFINGTIRSTMPDANFYFLNPYGIVFGEYAQLDLQGSFHASTADYLKLSDRGEFHARFPERDILTTAPIEHFGFLSNQAANLSIEKSQLNLEQNVSLTAGNISITDAHIKTPAHHINLTAQNALNISQQSLLETSDSGQITIRAGQFLLDNSAINSQRANGKIQIDAETIRLQQGATILSNSQNHTQGSDIILKATQSIQIVGENADKQATRILSNAGVDEQDSAHSGRVLLHAPDIRFEEGGAIHSNIYGSGQAGDIELIADESILLTGSGSRQDSFSTAITSSTRSQQSNAAQGANLFIDAKTITVSDNAEFAPYTLGKGLGGNLNLTASDIFFQDGFIIMSSSNTGRSGILNIQADNLLRLSESSYLLNMSFNQGDAGDIYISAKNMQLHEASYLMSIARHMGKASHINIKVADTLDISGSNPLDDTGWASSIQSASSPTQAGLVGGDGGHIQIEAGQLNISAGSNINTGTFSRLGLHAGRGGDIDVQVQGAVNISGVNAYGENAESFASGIYATSTGVGNNGTQGGNIRLQAQSLNLIDGGTIASSTDNYANSGTIDITVQDRIHISGDASQIALQAPRNSQILYLSEYTYTTINQASSGIYANSTDDSEQAGAGGHIQVAATDLILQDKGTISTSSAGGGKAGDISLDVQQLYIDNKANIASGSQFQNHYQFANIAERDNNLVVSGDVVEVADLGNGKAGYYVSVDGHLIQSLIPLSTVPNLAVLEQLSNTYRLHEGQIVTVEDAGNGESAAFIYSRQRRIDLDIWQRMDTQVTTVLDDIQPILAVRDDFGYSSDEVLPDYQLGERVRVLDMGDGKPAEFIHTHIIDPSNNQTFVRFVRVNQFELNNTQALATLSEQVSFQDQNPIATVAANQTPYIYTNGQWLAFNNQHHVDNILDMNLLDVAKTGYIAEMDDQSTIYTGKKWIDLNSQRQTVQTLADVEKSQQGDFVKVLDDGHPENYFYADGQWVKQQHGGNAGTIEIHADTIQITHNGTIETEAISAGGGGIDLIVDEMLYLNNSQVSASVQEGAGDGGSLGLSDPRFLVMNNAKLIAQAYEGHGGNIDVEAKGYLKSYNSIIDASSKFGISGHVVVDAPDSLINEAIATLSSAFLKISADFQPSCESNDSSHFTIAPKLGISNDVLDWRSAH